MSKGMRLSEAGYDRLAARNGEDETFSDVVIRLAGERSLLGIAGRLNEGTANDCATRSKTAAADGGRASRERSTSRVAPDVLLDPAVLVDLVNGDEDAVEKARGLAADLVQERLSATTLVELTDGIARATDSRQERERERERERVEDVLAS